MIKIQSTTRDHEYRCLKDWGEVGSAFLSKDGRTLFMVQAGHGFSGSRMLVYFFGVNNQECKNIFPRFCEVSRMTEEYRPVNITITIED